MAARRWSSGRAGAALAVVALGLAAPAGAAGQDDLARLCVRLEGESGECHLAAAAVRLVHPRLGVALWGGSPVPGTASTLGMRLGSVPRISLSTRLVLVPMELPPLPDRAAGSSRSLVPALSTQGTVGILPGLSPMPTVGGVLSLDAIGRIGYAGLPGGKGFESGGVWGWSLGLRVGGLRESFTLPGVSLTLAYGRSGGVAYGDPSGATTDGHVRGGISDLSATLAASKRIAAVGLTAGVAVDRYGSDVDLAYRSFPLGPRIEEAADATTDRWSGFVNASWTLLILHASAELGWQEAPAPPGLPGDVAVDPVGWWASVALRLSI
ncbi:MAG: hypothetical protein GWM90_33150 [Gemmatimonadetes bacterium]|nr:hypothetical protein [Gemmatimonadota bacterium]NIQ60168.1 hypothetical protein [Gemmatimonadota bacterium]NIU80384.1 hypothetical protein [Gammaproteobacteria bacterium]NIX48728.1 hypothetical protein [Gemmatimonadota bacterium]NIY13179.1 hypothetical protein [Gemmatimonadota bacterium]